MLLYYDDDRRMRGGHGWAISDEPEIDYIVCCCCCVVRFELRLFIASSELGAGCLLEEARVFPSPVFRAFFGGGAGGEGLGDGQQRYNKEKAR